jgi:hypothetical protein
MVKAANVVIVGRQEVGDGLVAVIIHGDVGRRRPPRPAPRPRPASASWSRCTSSRGRTRTSASISWSLSERTSS